MRHRQTSPHEAKPCLSTKLQRLFRHARGHKSEVKVKQSKSHALLESAIAWRGHDLGDLFLPMQGAPIGGGGVQHPEAFMVEFLQGGQGGPRPP